MPSACSGEGSGSPPRHTPRNWLRCISKAARLARPLARWPQSHCSGSWAGPLTWSRLQPEFVETASFARHEDARRGAGRRCRGGHIAVFCCVTPRSQLPSRGGRKEGSLVLATLDLNLPPYPEKQRFWHQFGEFVCVLFFPDVCLFFVCFSFLFISFCFCFVQAKHRHPKHQTPRIPDTPTSQNPEPFFFI